jgi:ubiquinone/menaquinone biosynthesis C-methylase UbiE
MTTTYVFDQAWQKERDRLTALESLFDGSSRRLLTGLGVGAGWRCLEVGCGAGSVALWLADVVGGTGRVVATDLDTRFLDGHGRANLEVRRHNVVTDPFDDAGFDLIHARAVLVHLPDRQQVLKRLVAALRPGGWLLIEDVDFGGAAAATLAQYMTAPPPAPAAMERIYQAVAALFAANGADPRYGSHVTGALADAGLGHVGAEVHAPVASGGSEQWTRGTVEQLAAKLVDTGLTSEADLELFLRVSAQPDTYYLPPLMVSAWGQRPL